MKFGAVIITLFIALLTVFGFILPLSAHSFSAVTASYLLTVIAAAGALGGIAFALYGWFTSRELPKMVDRAVAEKTKQKWAELDQKLYRQQEAMQKVTASYGIDNPDAKLDLLHKAVQQDPTVYNAYVTMGYVYWYDKEDFLKAVECFEKDLKFHPDNYQSASDLAALHARYKEYGTALKWMKRSLALQAEAWKDFDSDERFSEVKSQYPREYQEIIEQAQARTDGGNIQTPELNP